jgi:hypothetical protein
VVSLKTSQLGASSGRAADWLGSVRLISLTSGENMSARAQLKTQAGSSWLASPAAHNNIGSTRTRCTEIFFEGQSLFIHQKIIFCYNRQPLPLPHNVGSLSSKLNLLLTASRRRRFHEQQHFVFFLPERTFTD